MKTIAKCAVCGTHLVGENLLRVGSLYYCQPHFSQRNERHRNVQMEKMNRKLKRYLHEFDNLIDTDFTNWCSIHVTVDGNELST